MKINILQECKSKRENENIKSFTEFYISAYFPEITSIDIDCPDKNNEKIQPDYFLKQPRVLIELKEVHDREMLENQAAWSYNVERLENKLKSLNLNSIKGSYMVITPYKLKIVKGKESSVIKLILNAIISNQSSVYIEKLGKFEIEKCGDLGNNVGFMLMGEAGIIDSSGTIHENIGSKITKANEQLGSLGNNYADKGILLLVNKYILGNEKSKFIKALTYSYNVLLKCQHIDEIWLQRRTSSGKYFHTLLYDRNFLTSFDTCNIKYDKHTIDLFEKWFFSLSELGDEYKEKLFLILRHLLKSKKPYEVFHKVSTREQIVQLGLWLIKKNRFNDVIWIIEKFIDDPNPEEPDNYMGTPEHNYHKRLTAGENHLGVTTVLGHLAWLIQQLTVHKIYFLKAFNYTKELLLHKNLYIKLQAMIPLIEICARRQWLSGYGKRPYQDEYKELHNIVFKLVKIVKDNQNSKIIAETLSRVFIYYKDLSTEEASMVLDTLKITRESAGLFVYLGIYRQRHFKDHDIKYESSTIDKIFQDTIKEESHEYKDLRGSIAWQFWKILEEKHEEFDTISPYIELFLSKPYELNVFHHIERIIKEWIKIKPEPCISWYRLLLRQVSTFITSKQQLQSIGGIWFMHTEDIVDCIAEIDPVNLLTIVSELVKLRFKGVYIGDLKRLFKSYELISEDKQKLYIKKRFEDLYNDMKKVNPKLDKIHWD